MTDGSTSSGIAPDAIFAKKFSNAQIDIIAVGIGGFSLTELQVMANS